MTHAGANPGVLLGLSSHRDSVAAALGTNGDMKLFSTRTHGVLDYSSVVLRCALPRALGWSRSVRLALLGLGVFEVTAALTTETQIGLT